MRAVYKTHVTALKEYVNKNPRLKAMFKEFLERHKDSIEQQVDKEEKIKMYDLPKKKVVTIGK